MSFECLHGALHQLFRIVELLEHERDVHLRLAWKPIAAAVNAVLSHQRERVGEKIEGHRQPPARRAHHRFVVLQRVAMLCEYGHTASISWASTAAARRGSGWIVNISSLAGRNPFVGGAAYCASKAGLDAFSEALMQEVRYDNIRVSYVMPGSVATGFSGNDETSGADWKVSSDEVAEVVLNLLRHNPRSLPSRVELRPSKPSK